MFKLWPFGSRNGVRRGNKANAEPWPLTMPLLQFSRNEAWQLSDACAGTLVTGATGSGKTSGSGAAIADAFLRNGFGGLVLCAKSDEPELWQKYCKNTGRLDDLVLFGPNERWRYNFLDAERQQSKNGWLTENILNLFSTVLEIAEGQGGGREDEGYWRRASRQLLRNGIDLLIFATGHISIPDLYRVVVSSAKTMQEVKSEEWKTNSFCYQCLCKADKASKTASQKDDFGIVADYFLLELPGLSDKTRSVITSGLRQIYRWKKRKMASPGL